MARILWTACGLFWGGAGLSLFVGSLTPLYANAAAGLLYAMLLPPLVYLYLLVGWLRQEIDSGRIVIEPAALPQSRSVGGWSDPMADPMEPPFTNHTRYIESLHTPNY